MMELNCKSIAKDPNDDKDDKDDLIQHCPSVQGPLCRCSPLSPLQERTPND
jgi:hypothetical protein